MQYLSGILTDLFADWNRLHGVDARQQLPALQEKINAADMDGVLAAFKSVSNKRRKWSYIITIKFVGLEVFCACRN